MKTKKEAQNKPCSKCGRVYSKKESGVWTIKWPAWICRECALAANEAMKKIDKGKLKEGVTDLMAVNWGISSTEAKSKVKKTAKGLKNKQTQATAYQTMKKQGMSDKEIQEACFKAGWPDITKR